MPTSPAPNPRSAVLAVSVQVAGGFAAAMTANGLRVLVVLRVAGAAAAGSFVHVRAVGEQPQALIRGWMDLWNAPITRRFETDYEIHDPDTPEQVDIYVGADVGSSRTKVAVLDAAKHLLGYAVKKSGTDFTATVQECLARSLKMAGVGQADVINAISTGYGRKNVPFASDNKTEIGCHGSGCYLYFPKSITIIDIGGQDNKVIKLDAAGRRTSFKMNRKCAAGTGAFA